MQEYCIRFIILHKFSQIRRNKGRQSSHLQVTFRLKPMETNQEIKTNISTKVKNSYEQFFVFLSFMNTFSEAVVCRCSSK